MTPNKIDNSKEAVAKQQTSDVSPAQAQVGAGTKKREPGTPRYPYTITPGALRKYLKDAPGKPVPTKIDLNLLKSWGINDNNATTIIRVLDAVGLTTNGIPNTNYTGFMDPSGGAIILAQLIRATYKELFAAEHTPNKDDATLKRLFNIHGGTQADSTLKYMRDTFKALCEYANFDLSTTPSIQQPSATPNVMTESGQVTTILQKDPPVSFVLNVHIHLPEGRSSRDYERMFEDIGRYILKTKDENDRS